MRQGQQKRVLAWKLFQVLVLLQAQVRAASAVCTTEFWRSSVVGGTQAVVIQMQMYLKEPTMGEKDSPFQYWANNHARFPLLSAVAVKFLSAASASVESERLFGTASNIGMKRGFDI